MVKGITMTTLLVVLGVLILGGGAAYAAKKKFAPVPVLSATGTPTFSDSFNQGSIDTTKWTVQSRPAPCAKGCTGTYSPDAIDLSTGMLRITLTQTRDASGAAHSVGGEIKSNQLFGYGKYSYTMRVATTSPTPDGVGVPKSGSVSAGWNYVGNSTTEIDFEVLGSEPNNVYMTDYNNNANVTSPVHNTQNVYAVPNLADGFHTFVFVWKPKSIEFYIDGKYIATHTKNIATAPAHIIVNLWGNDARWGGTATPGVTRYMFVKNVSFTPVGN